MLAPCDVFKYIEGYRNRERNEWERTRLICFYSAMFGNSDPKKFPKRPEKFMPFEWDKKDGVKKLSALEILKINRDRNAQIAKYAG